jgi:hypothetical protein
VSITCNVSQVFGTKWLATRESGRLPHLCGGFAARLEEYTQRPARRAGQAVFVLRVACQFGQREVLVSPLLGSTVAWFEREMLPRLSEAATGGSWVGVVRLAITLQCKSSCVAACVGSCNCVERTMWRNGGWLRVPFPQLELSHLPRWWNGLTDGAEEDSAEVPWLSCPCGLHV